VDYKVNLDNFAGPMDLLLHLIRKEEIDVHDIPIARVLDQYLEFLKVIQELDLDDAGEFLVMAATLMVVKSKMLLPAERVDLTQEIDPRFELVRQLLEYKQYKDRIGELERREEVWAKRVGRPDAARVEGEFIPDKSIDEVTIFDLLKAFATIMEATGGTKPKERTIVVDDVPVRVFAGNLKERLQKDGSVLFSELFGGDAPRRTKIGWFLALLLLLKLQSAECAQDGDAGDIRIFLRDGAAAGGDEIADEFRA
jgi:segregation and condensation protein A